LKIYDSLRQTGSGVTRGGGRAGHWPQATTKKLKKSHTKGRQKNFFKGAPYYTGALKS